MNEATKKEPIAPATPQPIPLTNAQAAQVQLAVQQRDFARLQAEAAELRVNNTVQAIALELRIDPTLYELSIVQGANGLEFRPKAQGGA